MGSLGNRCNLEHFLNLWQNLSSQKNFKSRCYIAGDGPLYNDLKSKYETKHCVFLGYLDHDELSKYLVRSDIGLLPYANTKDFTMSFPTKVSDYLGFGLPILSNVKGEVENLINHSKVGAVYHSSASLENAIQKIMTDYKQMQKNAIDTFNHKFSDDSILPAFSKHLDYIEKELNHI